MSSPKSTSPIESSEDHTMKKRRRSLFKKSKMPGFISSSSGDADVSNQDLNEFDLTPGSLEVWIDLPEEIKYDPALAPFKQLYERSHGKVDPDQPEGDKNIFNKRNSELAPIGENEKEDALKEAEEKFLTTDETKHKSAKRQRFDKVLRIVKLTALVGAWLLLTVSLMLNSERDEVILHTTVKHVQAKAYNLGAMEGRVKVRVTLTGPFLQVQSGNGSRHRALEVWLHRGYLDGISEIGEGQNSSIWSIPLQPDDVLDFSPSVTKSKIIVISESVFKRIATKHADTLDTLLHITTDNDYLIPDITTDTVTNTETENNTGTTSYATTVADNVSVSGTDSFDRNTTEKEMTEKPQLKTVNKMKNYKQEVRVSLRMHTTGNVTVPVTLSYLMNPIDEESGVIYATLLLGMLYILIIFEVVNRTLAALLSSSLGIAVLAIGGARPTLNELMTWLDVETLLLLFSMMLLVAILAETGLFDYLAVLAYELTGGRTWPLINCLCFFTAIFSTFLDNVTTVLLMTPVTIRLCEVMQLNPIPVLMCMVIFSNVGGAATPVGDPPNVIIATHPAVINEGINFATFSLHMGFGIIMVAVQTYIQLRYMFRDMNKLRHTMPQDIIELRQEILVWRKAAASLSSYSRDEELVRKALERKVSKLAVQLRRREAGGGSRTDPNFTTTLADMKEKYCIRDKPLLIKSTICVSFVVMIFFLHAIPELQRLSLGWTALLGALLLLLLAERDDIEPILARVEWSTLLFFAALFVLMEALSKLGLIAWIGNMTENVILSVSEQYRLTVAILLILWVSGVVSAFVDNIPLTTMMVRVTAALSDPNGLGLPLSPLSWALSFGACLGGNGTLIGASANVVCAGVAEQHGYKITFLQFIKIGFPIMIGNLIVASFYLMLCHVLFTWH